MKLSSCRTCKSEFELTSKGQHYCADCQVCSVEGCGKSRGKGSYCNMHYDRLKTKGVLGGPRSTYVENGSACGQRVQDKVKAALAVLKNYPEAARDEGYRLIALESAESTSLLLEDDFYQFAGTLSAVTQGA